MFCFVRASTEIVRMGKIFQTIFREKSKFKDYQKFGVIYWESTVVSFWIPNVCPILVIGLFGLYCFLRQEHQAIHCSWRKKSFKKSKFESLFKTPMVAYIEVLKALVLVLCGQRIKEPQRRLCIRNFRGKTFWAKFYLLSPSPPRHLPGPRDNKTAPHSCYCDETSSPPTTTNSTSSTIVNYFNSQTDQVLSGGNTTPESKSNPIQSPTR